MVIEALVIEHPIAAVEHMWFQIEEVESRGAKKKKRSLELLNVIS